MYKSLAHQIFNILKGENIMMDGMGWGGMWFGPFFWLLIIGVIIWVVVISINNSRRKDLSNNFPQQESALDILKKRYAKGEITKEEFEQMKRDLNS